MHLLSEEATEVLHDQLRHLEGCEMVAAVELRPVVGPAPLAALQNVPREAASRGVSGGSSTFEVDLEGNLAEPTAYRPVLFFQVPQLVVRNASSLLVILTVSRPRSPYRLSRRLSVCRSEIFAQ